MSTSTSHHLIQQLKALVHSFETLRHDLDGLIEDQRLISRGYTIAYAVDHSEIFSYIEPVGTAERLVAFQGDTSNIAAAVQQTVLDWLFFKEDHRLILLAPYALELASYTRSLREGVVHVVAETLPEAIEEARKLVQDDEFEAVSKLVARIHTDGGSDDPGGIEPPDWERILGYFERNAATLLYLVEADTRDPLARLRRFLSQVKFEPLAALVHQELRVEQNTVLSWETALQNRRHRDSPSNYVDALAVAQVEAANEALAGKRCQVRLVTRSSIMRDEERDRLKARDERPWIPILRHPGAYIVLQDLEGVSRGEVLSRLEMLRASLDTVVTAHQDAVEAHTDKPPESRPAEEAELSRLLNDLRAQWYASLNLAAVAERSPMMLRTGTTHDRQRVLQLLDMVYDNSLIVDAFRKKLLVLVDEMDEVRQLMPLAIQSSYGDLDVPGASSEAGKGDARAITELERHVYWMPYMLEFDDARIRTWIDNYRTQLRVNLRDTLTFFRLELRRGLDYEVLLALAYTLAGWDQWQTAARYCDLALLAHDLAKHPREAHEALFLKALCLRGGSRENGHDFLQAYRLLEEAQSARSVRDPSVPPDLRYLKEKSTLLFVWAELGAKAPAVPPELEGVRLVDEAIKISEQCLERLESGNQMRAQVLNNLCYTCADSGDETLNGRAQAYLEQLLNELRRQQPDRWPVNYIDTVIWAAYRLRSTLVSPDLYDRLVAVLRRAWDEKSVRRGDQSDIKLHIDTVTNVAAPSAHG